MSVLQGDRTGIGLFAGGIALGIGGVALASREDGSAAVGSMMLYSGIGCIIANAIRAGNINADRKEYNNALRAALRVPDNVLYQITPSMRQFPDGTIVPSLALHVKF
jgi:hypothetical protein